MQTHLFSKPFKFVPGTMIFLFLVVGTSLKPLNAASPAELIIPYESELEGSSQLLLVSREAGRQGDISLRILERKDGQWKVVAGPYPAFIGYGGFARKGDKREGDGKTPTGLYLLGTAFGYAAKIKTKMPYRQATHDDYWIDDVNSSDYNTWVHGKSNAHSFEVMRRKDDLYKLGIVIEYNTSPIVPGKGSAIFLHVASRKGGHTAGCVAIPFENLASILAYLRPEAKPEILILP